MKKTKKDVYQDKITNVFKSDLVANAKFSKNYELPIIKRVDYKPEKAIAFCEVGSKKIIPEETWVHFYMHDYKFERVWNNPKKYLPILKKFKGVITTDFSLYREMPIAMQIWNTYRNRALAYYLQSNGINIIYNVRFVMKELTILCLKVYQRVELMQLGQMVVFHLKLIENISKKDSSIW